MPLTGEGVAPVGEEEITTDPEDPEPELPGCLKVVSSAYTFPMAEGTFEGESNAGNLVIYEGPATATVTTTQEYYINPAGTFHDDQCTDLAGPTNPIAATATVSGSGGSLATGSIDCGPDAAGYWRWNTDLYFEWTGGCDIVGNMPGFTGNGSTPDSTQHVLKAELIPPGPPTAGVYAYEYDPVT